MSDWIKNIKHYFVHAFGLALSLGAILHTMTQFSDVILFKVFFGAGGVFAGLSIQYLRGRAAAYRGRGRKGDIARANLSWAIVILCIIIFDFISAFTVLLTQIDKSEGKYDALVVRKAEISSEIKSLEDDIKTKKQERLEERKDRGRGKNYNLYETEIGKLESKLESKKRERENLREQVGKMDKSIFARLQEHSSIPAFWFELSMVGGLMFLIYLIPLLTPWNIKLETDSNENNPDETDSKTDLKTVPPSVKTKILKRDLEPRTCLNPECNTVFMPKRRDKFHCCDKCRSRAWVLGVKHPEETEEATV